MFSLEYSKNFVFPVGTMPSMIGSVSSMFLVLMPFCLLSGCLFTLFCAIVSEQDATNRISEIYSLESIGSVLGGFLFSLFLVFFFSTFQTLCLLMLLDLGVCLYLSIRFSFRSMQIAVILATACLLVLNTRLDLESIAKRSLYPGQDVLFHKDTPYGNLVITEKASQKNFYENGTLLFSTGDPVSNEDAVHYAMIQHPHPRFVLMIGGGISGTTTEVLKYGVARIDYVETNPAVIEAGRTYSTSLNDSRILAVGEDARRFVRHARNVYDVVLINLPDPSSAQINRYYTAEFFGQLKRKMAPSGVVGISLLESVDYMGSEARQLTSIIHNTLKSQFSHVLILPGLRNHILASDGDQSTDISAGLARLDISTVSLNQYYLDDELLGQRSSEIMHSVDTCTALNSDFTPVAYFHQLRYWLSYFGMNPWLPAVAMAILFLAVIARLNAVSLGVFAGGFAASSVEVIILISFQVIYGYVYQATGIIIAAFMAGLALGSFIGRKWPNPATLASYGRIQIALIIYTLLLPFVLTVLKASEENEVSVHIVFLILTVTVSIIVGLEFSLATRLLRARIASVASNLYSVDLIGSALGALAISIYILPLLGIATSSFIVASVCSFSAVTSFVAARRSTAPYSRGTSYV